MSVGLRAAVAACMVLITFVFAGRGWLWLWREVRFLRDTCRNYLTKWLCGTGDECMDSSSHPALLQALRHLHEDFAAVGVLEMLPESIAVMSSLLPEHFPQPPQPPRGAPNASSAAAGRLPRPQSLPHKHRATYPEPSAMAVDIITAWNANDIVLYVRTRRCVPGTMRGAGAGHRTRPDHVCLVWRGQVPGSPAVAERPISCV